MGYQIKKYYLDTCAWCRPFDEPHGKIIDETNASYEYLQRLVKVKLKLLHPQPS